MNNINEYKKRFFNLMESTIGDVKPIISEQITDTSRKVPPVTGNQTNPQQQVKPYNNLGTKPIDKPIDRPSKPQQPTDRPQQPTDRPQGKPTPQQPQNFIENFKNGVTKLFKDKKVQLNGDVLNIGNIKLKFSGNKIVGASIDKVKTVDGQTLPSKNVSLNIDLQKLDLNSALSNVRKTISQLNSSQSSSFRTTVDDKKVMNPNLPNQGTPLNLEEALIRKIIRESEQEMAMQKIESDPKLSSKMDMIVDYFSKLPEKKIEKIEDIVNSAENIEGEFTERKVTKYYDYDKDRPTELTKNQFLKRKLATILPSAILGAIMGIVMAGGISADDVVQMALGMATSTGLIGAGLISTVGREKVEVPDEEETQDSVTENYIRKQLRYYR